MRNDVHLAALRAAARVAFSVASVAMVNGCASEEASSDSASNESALASKDDAKPAPDATPSKPSKPSSCEAVLASAFPEPGPYQWEPVPQSAEVVACCADELESHGAMTPYRWDCCVAYDPATVPPGEEPMLGGGPGFACTPWGPPVPPSMDRLTKKRVAFTRKVSGLSILQASAFDRIEALGQIGAV